MVRKSRASQLALFSSSQWSEETRQVTSVDERRVIPGPTLQTSSTTTFGGMCDSSIATANHVVTDDANGAQTSVVTISGAVTATTTFNTTATAQVCK